MNLHLLQISRGLPSYHSHLVVQFLQYEGTSELLLWWQSIDPVHLIVIVAHTAVTATFAFSLSLSFLLFIQLSTIDIGCIVRSPSDLGTFFHLFVIFQSVIIIWLLAFNSIRSSCLHHATVGAGWTLDRVATCIEKRMSAGTSFAGNGYLLLAFGAPLANRLSLGHTSIRTASNDRDYFRLGNVNMTIVTKKQAIMAFWCTHSATPPFSK